MISTSGKDFVIIILTSKEYEDHPYSTTGVIARVLDVKGLRVGIIEKPNRKEDYIRLRAPILYFCITSSSIDSMLNNYTPLKKDRLSDEHSSVAGMPDTAVIFYCNRLREYFKGTWIVIGGIETSLQRERALLQQAANLSDEFFQAYHQSAARRR